MQNFDMSKICGERLLGFCPCFSCTFFSLQIAVMIQITKQYCIYISISFPSSVHYFHILSAWRPEEAHRKPDRPGIYGTGQGPTDPVSLHSVSGRQLWSLGQQLWSLGQQLWSLGQQLWSLGWQLWSLGWRRQLWSLSIKHKLHSESLNCYYCTSYLNVCFWKYVYITFWI